MRQRSERARRELVLTPIGAALPFREYLQLASRRIHSGPEALSSMVRQRSARSWPGLPTWRVALREAQALRPSHPHCNPRLDGREDWCPILYGLGRV
jgi:hypothetical protein